MSTETQTTAAPTPAPEPRPEPRGIAQLAAALAKAQGEFTNPERNRKVTVTGESKNGKAFSYTFWYADLATVLTVVRAPLAKNGLAVLQTIVQDRDDVFLRTILVHESGEQVVQQVEVGGINQDIKILGGRITYMRRYVLSALLGVASEEDDDENPNSGARSEDDEPSKPRERKARQQPKGEQQKAIDNKKPAAPMPWDGVADFAVKYESDFHVYLKVENGAIVQGDVRELLLPVLTELEVGLPKRQKYFADKNMTPMAECCGRDLKVVSGELTRRADAKDKKADTPAQSPAGAEDGGGETPVDATAGEQDGPAAAPVSSLTVATRAAHLNVELNEEQAKGLQLSAGLSDDELALLRLLTIPEVVAIAQHPANGALFDAALAPAIQGFVDPADSSELPLTPAWLAGAWAKCHNMNKERRLPARKLARIAILGYELGARADDIDAGKPVDVPATPATKEQVAAVDAWMLAITKDVPAAKALRNKLEEAAAGASEK